MPGTPTDDDETQPPVGQLVPRSDADRAKPMPRFRGQFEAGEGLAKSASWSEARRTLALCGAFLGLCAVLALSIFSMVRDQGRRTASPPEERHAEAAPAPEPSVALTAPAATSAEPTLDSVPIPPSEFLEETDDGEPGPTTRVAAKRYDTVQQAAAESCSTASIDGLSRQIIEQARCIKPNAFVLLPTRPNLVLSANVFPYLELEARNHLLRALDANSSGKMTIHSALRTVAQQYLVSRWAAGKRCGVQLATPPGESNHEVGAALDIAEPARWRSALEEQGFHWLGTSDRVHFDYKGGGDVTVAPDVLAFQVLWNRNHPEDIVPVDGHYGPAMERRLKRAPARGFSAGATCHKGASSGRHGSEALSTQSSKPHNPLH